MTSHFLSAPASLVLPLQSIHPYTLSILETVPAKTKTRRFPYRCLEKKYISLNEHCQVSIKCKHHQFLPRSARQSTEKKTRAYDSNFEQLLSDAGFVGDWDIESLTPKARYYRNLTQSSTARRTVSTLPSCSFYGHIVNSYLLHLSIISVFYES